jgi:hypothetical protein
LEVRGLGSSGFAIALGSLEATDLGCSRWYKWYRSTGVGKLPHHGNPDAWPGAVDVVVDPGGTWAHAAGGAVEIAGEGEFEFGPNGKGA